MKQQLHLPDNFGDYWKRRLLEDLKYNRIAVQDIEKIIEISRDLNKDQMHEILDGFMDHGLSINDVEIYAKKQLTDDEMEEIKLLLSADESALTKEEVRNFIENFVEKFFLNHQT